MEIKIIQLPISKCLEYYTRLEKNTVMFQIGPTGEFYNIKMGPRILTLFFFSLLLFLTVVKNQ